MRVELCAAQERSLQNDAESIRREEEQETTLADEPFDVCAVKQARDVAEGMIESR